MDLEKMLEAAIQKALASQMPQNEQQVVKADEVAATVLESVKSELPALVKAAVKEIEDREGVGSKRELPAAEPTLESDPVAYLIKKAKTVKSTDDWSVEEKGVIAGAFQKFMSKGMLGSDDED